MASISCVGLQSWRPLSRSQVIQPAHIDGKRRNTHTPYSFLFWESLPKNTIFLVVSHWTNLNILLFLRTASRQWGARASRGCNSGCFLQLEFNPLVAHACPIPLTVGCSSNWTCCYFSDLLSTVNLMYSNTLHMINVGFHRSQSMLQFYELHAQKGQRTIHPNVFASQFMATEGTVLSLLTQQQTSLFSL